MELKQSPVKLEVIFITSSVYVASNGIYGDLFINLIDSLILTVFSNYY